MATTGRQITRAIAIALGAALLLAACVPVPVDEQTWKDVPATSAGQAAASPSQRLLIGDTVRTHTIDNKTYLFRVYKIEQDAFYGTARNNKGYRIAYATLASMEVLRNGPAVAWVPVPIVASSSGSAINIGNHGPSLAPQAGGLGFSFLAWFSLAALMRRSSRHG